MGKVFRTVFICVVSLVIVGLIGYVIFVLSSGSITDEYLNQMGVCMAAANSTDGVFVQKDDGEHRLNDDGAKKLGYYLGYSDKISVCIITKGDLDGEKIKIRIGGDTAEVYHLNGSEDDAVIYFNVASTNKSYRVKIHYDGYWDGIRASIGEKYYS